MAGVARGLRLASDFLLPPLCISCREPVHAHGGLCARCWADIDFIVKPCCDRLGIPLAYPSGGRIVSAAALADPPVYDRARAVAQYNGSMRSLIHGLKYGDRHEGIKLMSRWMVPAGGGVLGDTGISVPVPLARTRLWGRRFNQAALLAQAIAHQRGIACNPIALLRTRRTESQVGLSASQRRKNVAGAFMVPEREHKAVSGKNILLVDDVITTGATANACARTLKRAGAVHVDVLALARVVDPLTPTL